MRCVFNFCYINIGFAPRVKQKRNQHTKEWPAVHTILWTQIQFSILWSDAPQIPKLFSRTWILSILCPERGMRPIKMAVNLYIALLLISYLLVLRGLNSCSFKRKKRSAQYLQSQRQARVAGCKFVVDAGMLSTGTCSTSPWIRKSWYLEVLTSVACEVWEREDLWSTAEILCVLWRENLPLKMLKSLSFSSKLNPQVNFFWWSAAGKESFHPSCINRSPLIKVHLLGHWKGFGQMGLIFHWCIHANLTVVCLNAPRPDLDQKMY